MKRNNLTSQIALIFCSASLFCSTQAIADPYIAQPGDFSNVNKAGYVFVFNNRNYTTGTSAIRLGKDYLLNKFKSLVYRSNLSTSDPYYLAYDRHGIYPYILSPYARYGTVNLSLQKNSCKSFEQAVDGSIGIDVNGFAESASATISNGTTYCTTIQLDRSCVFYDAVDYDSNGNRIQYYGTIVLGMDFRGAKTTYGGDRVYFSNRIKALIKKQKNYHGTLTAIEQSELAAGFTLSKQAGFDNAALYTTWRDYVDTYGYSAASSNTMTYTVVEPVPYRAGSACAVTTYSKIPVQGKMLLEGDYYEPN